MNAIRIDLIMPKSADHFFCLPYRGHASAKISEILGGNKPKMRLPYYL